VSGVASAATRGATTLAPGACVVFLSFNGGGFFPGAMALVAAVLAVLLALHVTLHPDPFGGLNGFVAVAAGALALLAVWTLQSALWSDAAGRAVIEFTRTLGYLLAFLIFALPPRTPGRVAWVLRGVALGIVIVAGIGLLSRVLPEVWPIRPGYADDRLSYPLTYWNAFGILAAIGTVLAFHLTASEREPPWARLAAAAAVPIVACALYFSFSRGAFGAAVIGLIVYAVVARPRSLVVALPAVGVPTYFAVRAAFGAEVLSSEAFASSAGVAEGRDVALAVGLAVAAAVLLRALALAVDAPLAKLRPRSRRLRGPAVAGVALVMTGAVVAVPVALGAPAYVERQYERFKAPLPPGLANRERFFVPSNNERLAIWRVGVDGFESEHVHGTGAGTYQLLWERNRPKGVYNVTDGHSLYVEVLAELGIVGAVLLTALLVALVVGTAVSARGPDRHTHAAVLAGLVAWALHAGIDWDWEMPAVTLWAFALGGAALAARGARALPAGRTLRLVVGVACVVLAVTPVLVLRSQAQLDTAARALEAGDCRTAIDAALGSLEALNVRAEPFEVLGYCDARLGQSRLGVQAMEQAVRRDPGNWQMHYGLAVVRAAAGEDPRPAARRALELNPGSPLAREAERRFRAVEDPASWRRRARRARLPEL
jgi:O-antigen ligase